MKPKTTFSLVQVSLLALTLSLQCKPSCQEVPDFECNIMFDIVSSNGTSLLENVYPAEKVKIYKIEDSMQYIYYWKDPSVSMLGLQYFMDKFDMPGNFDVLYGIKLNESDTDTLHLLFTVGNIKNCNYLIGNFEIYYNNVEYDKDTFPLAFQKNQ